MKKHKEMIGKFLEENGLSGALGDRLVELCEKYHVQIVNEENMSRALYIKKLEQEAYGIDK